jgi:DNA polymerase III delta subunit
VRLVDKAMIDLLIPHENFDAIFPFLDAVAQKNKALALKLFEQQIKKGEAELMILNSLVRQIRTLIHIKAFVEKNGAISSDAIAQTISIHPYVAKKSISQAQQFTTAQLNSIYKYLQTIDEE